MHVCLVLLPVQLSQQQAELASERAASREAAQAAAEAARTAGVRIAELDATVLSRDEDIAGCKQDISR